MTIPSTTMTSPLTRLRSLAKSLNSPQSKRRDTMAGVLYEARREVAEILAEMEAASPDVAQSPAWQSFDGAPRDGTKITAWHQMWKCPVSVSYIAGRRSQCKWVEATITTEWPDEAFTHWQPLLDGPSVSSTDQPPALAPTTDWRDISTAPRDGTAIDVWFRLNAKLGARWTSVRWSEPREAWIGGPPSQHEGGWIATHWKPLPEPPALAVKTTIVFDATSEDLKIIATDGDRNE